MWIWFAQYNFNCFFKKNPDKSIKTWILTTFFLYAIIKKQKPTNIYTKYCHKNNTAAIKYKAYILYKKI